MCTKNPSCRDERMYVYTIYVKFLYNVDRYNVLVAKTEVRENGNHFLRHHTQPLNLLIFIYALRGCFFYNNFVKIVLIMFIIQ